MNSNDVSSVARPRVGLVLTDHVMRAVAQDRPPMGGGFPKRLVKRAGRLEIAHSREGQVFFTLVDRVGAVLAEKMFESFSAAA